MKEFWYCPHCSKNIRLSEDIGLSVYVGSRDFLCEVVLIVPESPSAVVLHRWVYRASFRERILKAEIQGRKDDEEEEAFFEFARKLRKSKMVGRES